MILPKDTSATKDREIVVTRLIDAPRERVFRAFTLRDQIGHWWGPTGFRTTTHDMDVRPGGTWRFVMHGPDGTDYDNFVRYIEVVEPKRLLYDHGTDAESAPQFQVTVTFEEQNGRTLLTMRSLFPTTEARDYVVRAVKAIEGAEQTLGRLAAFVGAD